MAEKLDFIGKGTVRTLRDDRVSRQAAAEAEERASLITVTTSAKRLAGLLREAGALPSVGLYLERQGAPRGMPEEKIPETLKGWIVSYEPTIPKNKTDQRVGGPLTLLTVAGGLAVCRTTIKRSDLPNMDEPRDPELPIVEASVPASEQVYAGSRLTYDRLVDMLPSHQDRNMLSLTTNLGMLANVHHLDL